MSEQLTEEISDDDVVQETAYITDTTCISCHAEFLDVEDLEVHVLQMHRPMAKKSCQFCDATYKDMIDYACHVRDAHLIDLRSCLYCGKVFQDGGKLKIHENHHFRDDKTLYSCSQCKSIYHDCKLLRLHELKNHDNDKDGLVFKCLPYLSSILCLRADMLLKTIGKKTYKCVICNFTSLHLATYLKHFDTNECKVYVCNNCSGAFKDKKNTIKHLKTARYCKNLDEFSDNVMTCGDCHALVHPKAMQAHLKTCDALKCKECNIVYNTIDELSAHHTRHHPVDMSVVQCKFCMREYFGKVPLKKHVAKVHKADFHLYKYKCTKCNIIFKHPQKLFAHFFTVHKNLHPFTCKICNKTFRVRKGFSLHIKLNHKSVGFVEFNDQYHVFFTAKKSEKPFVPECVLSSEEILEYDSDDTGNKKKGSNKKFAQDLSDTDLTDAESPKKPVKRKLSPKQMKRKQPKTLKKPVLIYSSDEEPLLEVRKRVMKTNGKIRRNWSWKKNLVQKHLYSCTICGESCYTYQNHQNHMSQHNKNQELECVKCLKKFNDKTDLTKHMSKEHATSKLTETLKNLLQKKKQDDKTPTNDEPLKAPKKPDKFKIVMKKVKFNKSEIPATIIPVDKDVSVKNFIENFTPEVTENPKDKLKTDAITIKRYNSPYYKESTIKLTKFKNIHIDHPVPLKMPERFKLDDNFYKTKIKIKLVHAPPVQNTNFILSDYNEHDYTDSFQNNDYDNRNDIPEVAQEVSLGTEEIPTPKPTDTRTTRIVIPKLPKGYSKLHIATLQPEAPYFKIIKVESNKLQETQKEEPVHDPSNDVINLPDGTKLVNANPLAHLLGDTAVTDILEPTKNKYYKPVIKDFQGMLAQAMKKLEDTPLTRKRNRKTKEKNIQNSS